VSGLVEGCLSRLAAPQAWEMSNGRYGPDACCAGGGGGVRGRSVTVAVTNPIVGGVTDVRGVSPQSA